jgi:hypothetical protein
MTKSSKCATAFMLTLLASMMIITLAPALVNAQAANSEHVIIQAGSGGTTNPGKGDYSYTANSLVVITATPADKYIFLYWLINGTGTNGDVIPPADVPTLAPDQTLPPDAGGDLTVVGRPGYEFVGQDNYVSTLNPIVIACQAGYTFQYTPVFALKAALPTPVPTATPVSTATPPVTSPPSTTSSPTTTPTKTVPEFNNAALVLVIAAIAVVTLCAVVYKKTTIKQHQK